MTHVLHVQQLSVSYRGQLVLADVNLSLEAGESLAVVGPSGSGKSSLLSCIAGLQLPSAGKVVLRGQELSSLGASRRADLRQSSIGLVFQAPELLPELTVVENAAVSLLFSGCRRADALRAGEAMLERLAIAHLADNRIDEISGGEAQRVAVARSLLRRSLALLIADEPTASLDRANAETVVAMLLKETTERGVPAVVATHDPDVAAACDRVLELRSPSRLETTH